MLLLAIPKRQIKFSLVNEATSFFLLDIIITASSDRQMKIKKTGQKYYLNIEFFFVNFVVAIFPRNTDLSDLSAHRAGQILRGSSTVGVTILMLIKWQEGHVHLQK